MKGSTYEGGLASCLGYLAKRAVLLAAKLLGFKGFCLFLATALLFLGRIGEDVWLTLAVTLVCSASGIRVLDSLREGSDAQDLKKFISARLEDRAGKKEELYETIRNDTLPAAFGWNAAALPGPAADGSRQASDAAERAAARRGAKATGSASKEFTEKGRKRIRAALDKAGRQSN